MKNPLIPAGIEPATFRFVSQRLNHCTTAVPVYTVIPLTIYEVTDIENIGSCFVALSVFKYRGHKVSLMMMMNVTPKHVGEVQYIVYNAMNKRCAFIWYN